MSSSEYRRVISSSSLSVPSRYIWASFRMSHEGLPAPHNEPWIRFSIHRELDDGNWKYSVVCAARVSHHDGARLPDGCECLPDMRSCGDSDRHNHAVSALPVGESPRELARLFDSCGRVRGTEVHGHFPLHFHWVDGDDLARSGICCALDGVDADSADAHDDHRVAGTNCSRIHG